MPKVIVNSSSQLVAEEAFDKVSELLQNDTELRKLDASYKCDFDRSKLTGQATGKLFKASMEVVSSGNGSEVKILVNLPLHLAIAKGMVEKTLKHKLEKAIS